MNPRRRCHYLLPCPQVVLEEARENYAAEIVHEVRRMCGCKPHAERCGGVQAQPGMACQH